MTIDYNKYISSDGLYVTGSETMTGIEVFEQIKYNLKQRGLLPNHYFLLDKIWEDGRTLPEEAWFRTFVNEGKEGICLTVEVRYWDEEQREQSLTFAKGQDLERSNAQLDRMHLISSEIVKMLHGYAGGGRRRVYDDPRLEAMTLALGEGERETLIESLMLSREHYLCKALDVERLLRRAAGSITAFVDLVGARPMNIEPYDYAVLAMQDGNLQAFTENLPRIDDPEQREVLMTQVAGRPGPVGVKMLLHMLDREYPQARYREAGEAAIGTGEAARVELIYDEAGQWHTPRDTYLLGALMDRAFQKRSPSEGFRIGMRLLEKAEPRELKAAPSSLYLHMASRGHGAEEILYRFAEAGVPLGEDGGRIFQCCIEHLGGHVVERLLNEYQVPVSTEQFFALHVCMTPQTLSCATALLNQGFDLDAYRNWAESRRQEVDAELLQKLEDYVESRSRSAQEASVAPQDQRI